MTEGGANHPWNLNETMAVKNVPEFKQVALMVILKDEQDREFALVTNHLKSGKVSEDVYEKGYQNRYLAGKILEHCKDMPIIQVGDMNTTENSKVPTVEWYEGVDEGTLFPCHCEPYTMRDGRKHTVVQVTNKGTSKWTLAHGFETTNKKNKDGEIVETVEKAKVQGEKKMMNVEFTDKKEVDCHVCMDEGMSTRYDQFYGFFNFIGQKRGKVKAVFEDFPDEYNEFIIPAYLDSLKLLDFKLLENKDCTALKFRIGGDQTDKYGKTAEVIDMAFYDNNILICGIRGLFVPGDAPEAGGSYPCYTHPSDHNYLMILFQRVPKEKVEFIGQMTKYTGARRIFNTVSAGAVVGTLAIPHAPVVGTLMGATVGLCATAGQLFWQNLCPKSARVKYDIAITKEGSKFRCQMKAYNNTLSYFPKILGGRQKTETGYLTKIYKSSEQQLLLFFERDGLRPTCDRFLDVDKFSSKFAEELLEFVAKNRGLELEGNVKGMLAGKVRRRMLQRPIDRLMCAIERTD